MACYSVFLKATNKQIRVFHYDLLKHGDYMNAWARAVALANKNHDCGYPCTVEEFSVCDSVGKQIYDTSAPYK